MKEPYEKPDIITEEIFERTALSCGGSYKYLLPTGATTTYLTPCSKTDLSVCESLSS